MSELVQRITFPPYIADHFTFRRSPENDLIVSTGFSEQPLGMNRIILCYAWTEEELRNRYPLQLLQQHPELSDISASIGMATINYVTNGFVLDKVIPFEKIQQWSVVESNIESTRQRLEYLLLDSERKKLLEQQVDEEEIELFRKAYTALDP